MASVAWGGVRLARELVGGPRRRWLLGLGALVLLLLGLVLPGVRAERALTEVERLLPSFSAAVDEGDPARVVAVLDTMEARAASAERATGGLGWSLASYVPVAGRTPRTVRALSVAAHDALREGCDTAQAVLPVLQGARGQRVSAGVDLGRLASAEQVLRTTADRVERVRAALADAPSGWVLPPVARARGDLVEALHRTSGSLRSAAEGARALPALLGDGAPRTYLLVLQNNAEARGTGGLVGGFALLTAAQGRLSVQRLGSNVELERFPGPALRLGRDLEALYGRDLSTWENTNLSPHFPTAARLLSDVWLRGSGQRVDGVLATDPTFLARLLELTGPVSPDGGPSVDAANVVELIESTAYEQFDPSSSRRKDALVATTGAVLQRVLGPAGPRAGALIGAVREALPTRSLMVWSAHPREQQWLRSTALSGEIPSAPGPFAFLVVNNSAANKLDYYLDRSLRYQLGPCGQVGRPARITAVLRYRLPGRRLPDFVAGRRDDQAAGKPYGSSSLIVSVYLAKGATLQGATLDGQPVKPFLGHEAGRPVAVLEVQFLAGRARTLALEVQEGRSSLRPVVPEQSLARRQVTTVSQHRCG